MLDPPDRIPPQRFSFGRYGRVLDCRHGRVLVRDVQVENEVAVWDPITGEERLLTVPSEFRGVFLGVVLCAATDHVHGRCHSSPFKVVLVLHERPVACVYYSETGLWGNLIGLWGNLTSTEAPCRLCCYCRPAVLVGNCLYWMTFSNHMLVFDLDANSLTMIRDLPIIYGIDLGNGRILQAEDGVVGFAILSYPRLHMWQLNVNAHGGPTWVPRMTVEMHRIPGLPPRIEQEESACMLGYDEDTDSLFLHVRRNVYGVQLKLMQSRKLYEKNNVFHFSPFKSFYTPAIAGGPNAAEMVHIG